MPKPQPRAERTCCDCGDVFTAGPYARWCLECRLKQRPTRKKKYVWTSEKDAYLRDHYDGKVKGRAAEIAQLWGWPTWVVKKHAAQLGLCYHVDRCEYSAEEEQFLLDHAGSRTTYWMAKKLKRSHTSVVLKLKRMKISRRFRDGYTLRDLELCFGTDHHVIERWVRKGFLRAKKRGTFRDRDAWCVSESDILRFISNYPLEFRLDKVDQLWFMDLVLGGGLLCKKACA